MRYIKTYEELNVGEIQVGDYVICEILKFSKYYDIDYVNFINTHIGVVEVVNIINNYVRIEYGENVPGNDMIVTYTYLDTEIIKYWSKNKEDLEVILQQKKYNL
jgi:hypothetical protein